MLMLTIQMYGTVQIQFQKTPLMSDTEQTLCIASWRVSQISVNRAAPA
jgi:hypothetical protein